MFRCARVGSQRWLPRVETDAVFEARPGRQRQQHLQCPVAVEHAVERGVAGEPAISDVDEPGPSECPHRLRSRWLPVGRPAEQQGIASAVRGDCRRRVLSLDADIGQIARGTGVGCDDTHALVAKEPCPQPQAGADLQRRASLQELRYGTDGPACRDCVPIPSDERAPSSVFLAQGFVRVERLRPPVRPRSGACRLYRGPEDGGVYFTSWSQCAQSGRNYSLKARARLPPRILSWSSPDKPLPLMSVVAFGRRWNSGWGKSVPMTKLSAP